MAGLFDTGGATTLEQVLGNQANAKAANINDQYTQGRKRLVAQQAASGRLMSGVSDYNLGDFDKEAAGAQSGVYSDLASSLAGVPAEDYLNQRQYGRSLDLAKLIGSLQKPSELQEALGALSTAGNVAAKFKAATA